MAVNTRVPEVVRLADTLPEEIIFGPSEVMQGIRRKLEKLAGTIVPVLLEGESGTGKEIIARYIHAHSPLSLGAFVKISCAAIPGDLTESELFGYGKGAFTGAKDSKPGRIEQAHKGTLYLDEIAEVDPQRQAKLLQVLQDGHFCRLGDHEEIQVDTRVICATNRNLRREISSGAFRQDLFYRINVFHICLPTLSERREDIPQMAGFLLSTMTRRFGQSRPPLTDEIMNWMRSYPWPGNIRELENWIIRYVLLGTTELPELQKHTSHTISFSLPAEGNVAIPLKRITKNAMLDAERALILKTLEDHRWNRRRAAEALKVSYRALIYKIRQAGLSTRRSAPKAERPSLPIGSEIPQTPQDSAPALSQT